MKKKLSDLKTGQIGIISKIDIKDKKIKRHFLDMGLTKGVIVRIKRIAPFHNPVCIELRGYELAIAKENLKNIEIEVIKN